MFPRSFRLLAAPAALLVGAAALAGAELVLLDGRVLSGDSVRREGDLYVLSTRTGDVTMPAELVDRVQLTGEPESRPIQGIPEGPTALRDAGPQQLAGAPVQPSTPEQQTAAIGNPSSFRKSPVNSEWHPTSAYDMSKDVLADSRSTFVQSPVDPEWHPTSAFDPSKDVLADSRSTFAKSPIDSSWTPTDGFKKTGW
ncbi:MAG TPA: hypothetical protein VFV75_11425 [Candidatus Polarisedimenticolaceae bacterium]|nr:hypothetical protein [Candidatus Polarisedimenticolaceae bacterium]